MWTSELRAAFVAALVTSLALAACKGEPGREGTCTRDRDGACTTYPADRAVAGRRMCAGFTWRDGARTCPTENRLGSCTTAEGLVEVLYGGPPNHFTEATAEARCKGAGGQWAGSSR